MPKMKPIMNPPPITALGIENATKVIPNAFLFVGLLCSIMELSNIMAPHMSPRVVRILNGTESLDVPGIVGIIQGNQVVTAPRSSALINIKIPAIREKVNVLDFSIRPI